ncbi:MAG TPA: M56 family metallopeptidase [Gemmatimonadaceae bacterium]|nr:M56 family metallopeptidase [Gemmatimonadaceae bacterium]
MQTLISSLTAASAAFVASLGTLAVKAALVLALAWIATRSMRRSSAALRHSVWTAAITATILLPLLALTLPTLRAPIPGARAVAELAARIATPAAPAEGVDAVTSAPERAGPATTPKVTVTVRGDTSDALIMAAAAAAASTVEEGPVDVEIVAARPALPFWAVVLLIWIAGATLALVPMALGVVHLRRIAGRVQDVESDALDDYAAQLARTLGVHRVVRVVEGEPGATPMTWGVFRPVVMVPGGFSEWPEEQQRDVLLHELAHVARYDCLTQHLARFACALYWFNPLTWVAATRLRVERERACDDRVLLAGARPSAYADHLLTIARTLRTPGIASAAALAMARPSHLEGRLLALLDGRRPRGPVTPGAAATVAGAMLGVAAMLAMVSPWAARAANAAEVDNGTAAIERNLIDDTLPPKATTSATASSSQAASTVAHDSSVSETTTLVDGRTVTYGPGSVIVLNTGPKAKSPESFRLQGCDITRSGSSSAQVWTDDDDKRMRAEIKRGGCSIRLETEGDVTFNAEYTDVVAIASGGSFEIYDRGGDDSHKLRIEPGSGGALTRTWTVNNQVRPYDAEAQKWLRESLQALDKYTDFSNGARLNTIYKEKGANGVIEEVSTSESDYAKRVGVGRLLKLARLDEAQVGRVIDVASNMSSDYDKSELLRGLLKERLVTPALQGRYIKAASNMSSDYELDRTLQAIVDEGVLTTQSQGAIYEVAGRMSSDYERGQLMKAVAKKYGLAADTWRGFVDAASRFSSDYELRTMLTAAVKDNPKLPDATIDAVVDLVRTKIDSDYEKAEFFIAVSRSRPPTEAEQERLAKAAESISSEYEYGRVLAALRKRRVSGGNL